MKSLYMRQFLVTVSMILISFFMLGAAFIALSYRYLVNDKQDTLAVNAQSVAHTAASYLTEGKIEQDWDFRINISTISRATSTSIFVCDTDGQIISCSDEKYQGEFIGTFIPAIIAGEVLQAGEYSGMSTLGDIFQSSRYIVGVSVTSVSGETVGMVFIAADASALTNLWRAFASIFFFIALAVMALASLLSSIASKRMTQPLKEMAIAARRFARGEFSVRVNSHNREDEIGELAAAFNSMAESLEKSETLRREFIANISHELKTPMTTIAGYIEGILDGTMPGARHEEYLQVVAGEIHRLSRLVRRMLDISQLQAPEKAVLRERFDISEVMRRVLLGFEQKILNKELDVNVRLPDDPVYVTGDSDAITQVGYNLLDNAVKFSDKGSVLGLSVTQKGSKVYVSVRNTGEPIKSDELPLIFDRFHKADRSRSADRDGVGLGLYIVKTILNNHNEKITVTSENRQTEFIFTLTACK